MATEPVRTTPVTVVAPVVPEARAIRASLGAHAHVVRSGCGPARARRLVRRLQRHWPGRPVAVAGVCGGLHPALVPGSVIVARELQHPTLRRALPSADGLAAALAGHGIDAHVGPLVSIARFAPNLRAVRDAYPDALGVDMESAWLAELADTRPFAVLRVVIDTPDAPLRATSLWRHGRHALNMLRTTAPALVTWAEWHG